MCLSCFYPWEPLQGSHIKSISLDLLGIVGRKQIREQLRSQDSHLFFKNVNFFEVVVVSH